LPWRGSAACAAAAAEIPRAAAQYQRALTANVRLVWGLDAPVATFAGQVHQESGWKPDARSPYAGGLAQFTPATAEWIGGVFPDLAERQPFNPDVGAARPGAL
jgi:soluble lytic murein transglycosylase-like protein